MNIREFNEELKNIHDSSWGYGNEILYCMTKDSNDLQDKDKLAGAIWLIGRAYAASPQRRSYGKTATGEKYKNSNSDEVIRPIWPVKTQNDGREEFFNEIAKNINTDYLLDLIKKYDCKSTRYCFSEFPSKKNNYSIYDVDRERLIASIVAVLSFNKSLSAAIEIFDRVDLLPNHTFEGESVSCNNHISFSSKFLHFYFPNLVFIIDNFAYNGGALLFNGSEAKTKRRYIYTPPTDTAYFAGDIYDEFSQETVKKLFVNISKEVEKSIGNVEADEDKKTNSGIENGSELEGKHYIYHCIRSYLMGCYLAKNNIFPTDLIRYNKPFKISSLPRLTDTIFLNIKKALTPKEIAYQKSLEETFYKRCNNTKEPYHDRRT